ncbi:MAG TPA: TlpA disulfide reductase family protein [Thermodesulfovibrionales bacterium]|nr:TlpA disulfide reductase family protein [Thermodesulfovibrionales bacterium]
MKKRSVILLIVLVLAVLVMFFGIKNEESPRQTIANLDAPDFTITDAAGKTLSLAELKGTVVFINFWATWCPPCKEEMPSIQSLYSRFKDDGGFRMVTILYKDDYDKAMAYQKENNFGLPVWLDNKEKTAKAYGVTGVPETYIVDKKGILRQKVIGPADWTSPEAISLISKLLKE